MSIWITTNSLSENYSSSGAETTQQHPAQGACLGDRVYTGGKVGGETDRGGQGLSQADGVLICARGAKSLPYDGEGVSERRQTRRDARAQTRSPGKSSGVATRRDRMLAEARRRREPWPGSNCGG